MLYIARQGGHEALEVDERIRSFALSKKRNTERRTFLGSV
jgi:hypothetical protein